jgi:hypothetical protein
MNNRTKTIIRILLVLLILFVITAFTHWYKFRRNVPQPAWITATARDNFLYGSIGDERYAGMPYWIWLVLPRIFPEYLPYPGGYVALGLTWEEGKEMPAGFSKKTVGYVRVAANCALCHAASYRATPDATPEVVGAIPGHTVDLQPLLTFLKQCAQDPRFNGGELLAEIDMATKFSFLDRLIYRFILIPRTRQALIDQGMILNTTLRAHGQNPTAPFSDAKLKPLEDWVRGLLAPAYPLPINSTLAGAGKPLFAQHCASCHSGSGKVYPVGEIGTDRTQLNQSQAASKAADGYIAPPLSGSWLRGPYLHNGSVPSLRELLAPQAQRRPAFFPGNDIIDAENGGFLSTIEEEPGRRKFARYDTTTPGHSNAGHLYATGLSRPDKDALLEYLKTR